jgi:hypothetical protein
LSPLTSDKMFERMIAAIPAREFVLRHLGRRDKPPFMDERALPSMSDASRPRQFRVLVRIIVLRRESIFSMTKQTTKPRRIPPFVRFDVLADGLQLAGFEATPTGPVLG